MIWLLRRILGVLELWRQIPFIPDIAAGQCYMVSPVPAFNFWRGKNWWEDQTASNTSLTFISRNLKFFFPPSYLRSVLKVTEWRRDPNILLYNFKNDIVRLSMVSRCDFSQGICTFKLFWPSNSQGLLIGSIHESVSRRAGTSNLTHKINLIIEHVLLSVILSNSFQSRQFLSIHFFLNVHFRLHYLHV